MRKKQTNECMRAKEQRHNNDDGICVFTTKHLLNFQDFSTKLYHTHEFVFAYSILYVYVCRLSVPCICVCVYITHYKFVPFLIFFVLVSFPFLFCAHITHRWVFASVYITSYLQGMFKMVYRFVCANISICVSTERMIREADATNDIAKFCFLYGLILVDFCSFSLLTNGKR